MMFFIVFFILFFGCAAYLFRDEITMISGKDVPVNSILSNAPLIVGLSSATKEIRGQNENFYIGINEEKRIIKLGVNKSKMFRTRDNYKNYSIKYRVFDYKDIISVEIIEDSVTVSKTNRTSQLVGAGIGGAIAGGAGAIVGGLSGKTTGSTEITNITLRVITTDEQNTVFDLPFLEKKSPIKKSSNEYSKAIQDVHKWNSIIKNIINHQEKERTEKINNDKSKEKQTIENTEVIQDKKNNSIVDEIERLANMKDQGVLSDIEFNKLKSKLIEQNN